MHLEGALSPTLLHRLSARNNIPLPSASDDAAFTSLTTLQERYENFSCLEDFLHYYYIATRSLQHAVDFEELAWSYFQRAARDGCVHVEVSIDPQAHTERGVAFETIVEGVGKARARAEKELALTSVLVCCFLRHLGVQASEGCWEAVRGQLRAGGVEGVGLDSTEVGNPPGRWKGVFEKAGQDGFRKTAHVGEEGPVEYIREAMRELDVERVDHGIRLAEDEGLMKEVAEKGILLTVCPLSNVRLKCVENVGQVPIRKFLEAGVKFSINSDDPAYFGGFILDNYCAVQEAFDLTIQEWEGIAKTAIEGSWCGKERKAEVRGMIDEVVTKHSKS